MKKKPAIADVDRVMIVHLPKHWSATTQMLRNRLNN